MTSEVDEVLGIRELLSDLLPNSFRYEIGHCTPINDISPSESTGMFNTVVHLDCKTEEDCNQWVEAFAQTTYCTWRIHRTYPKERRGILYRKDYVCQYSHFRKGNHLVKMKTKDWHCKAHFIIKIRAVTKSNKRDLYLSQGLPCILSLFWTHNHQITTAEALYLHSSGTELHNRFLTYFDLGMTSAEAMKYHRKCLEMVPGSSKLDLSDRNKNPKPTTVYLWHKNWEKDLGGSHSASMLEVSDAQIPGLQETYGTKVTEENLENELTSKLPTEYRAEIASCVPVANPADGSCAGFRAIVHVECRNSDDCDRWLHAFERLTYCTLRVRRTFATFKRGILYQKDYVCQHSSYNKSPHLVQKMTKDTACPARLSIKIQEENRWNSTDKYMSQGLACVVSLHWVHNHRIFSAEALSHRVSGHELQDRFASYFSQGMNPSAAMKHHKECLKIAPDFQEQDFVDAAKNPMSHVVYRWHAQWRQDNLGSSMINLEKEKTHVEPETIAPQEGNDETVQLDMQVEEQNDVSDHLQSLTNEYLQLMKLKFSRFGNRPACISALRKAVSRLRTVSTPNAFASFLHKTDRLRTHRAGVSKVQPSSHPVVTRGNKRLACSRRPLQVKRRHCLADNIDTGVQNASIKQIRPSVTLEIDDIVSELVYANN